MEIVITVETRIIERVERVEDKKGFLEISTRIPGKTQGMIGEIRERKCKFYILLFCLIPWFSDRKNIDRDRRSKNDVRHRRHSRSRSSSRDHWDKNSISSCYSEIPVDRGSLRNKKSYGRENSRGRNYDSSEN